METLSPNELISVLIKKIQNDWERANGKGSELSRIDKDILIDDLKKVYELVYDLDTAGSHVNFPSVVNSPENIVEVSEVEQAAGPGIRQEIPVDERVAEEPVLTEKQPEEQEIEPVVEAGEGGGLNQAEEDIVLNQAEVEFEIESARLEEEDKPVQEEQKVEPVESPVEKVVHAQVEVKTTLDLFSASKTLADVYQNDTDNSLVAKIQQNKVSDIRTVIGINDKFLFINEIFKGEMSSYNQAIEKLNQTDVFHEALQIIDDLKITNGSDENKTTFIKLVEIAKRRFH